MAAVGVTLVVAATLVRSSARHEALSSLARQASLIATQQRAAPASGDEAHRPRRLLRHPAGAPRDPLAPAGRAAASGRTAATRCAPAAPPRARSSSEGSATSTPPIPKRKQAVVLLRPAKLASSDLRPFTIAFGIAAAVGRRDRRDRRLLARPRRLAADRAGLRGEPRPRRRRAPRAAAGCGLDRGGRTRRVVQPARRRPRPREGRRTVVPALGQPRAEDPARGDPRARRGADRRRDDRAEGRRGDRAGVEAARAARPRPARPRPPEPALVLRPPARDRPLGRRRAGREPARCRVGPRRRLADRRDERPRAGDRRPGPAAAGALEPDRERAPLDAGRRLGGRRGAARDA